MISRPLPLLITLARLIFYSTLGFYLLMAGSLLLHPIPASAHDLTPFSDLPSDPMYTPAIQLFQQEHLLVGDTRGGEPIGTLRPDAPLKRAELAKIAGLVRLAEQYGESQNWTSIPTLDEFTLKTNSLLLPYYSPSSENLRFHDVPDKDPNCAAEPSGCSPWFTEYVNYAASIGMVKGYPNGYFYPDNTIIRIHALKLIMAGGSRYQTLSSDPRIKNVDTPKCLKGAEPYILNNNGGDQSLLDFAILADKLDFFGSSCQLFTEYGATTPIQRADLLQKPLTRKEASRYLSLTTTYPPLRLNPTTDPTTSTAEENGFTYSDPNYSSTASTQPGKTTTTAPTPAKPRTQTSTAVKEEEEEPVQTGTSYTQLPAASATAIVRCCQTTSIYSTCRNVLYSDYSVRDDSVYGSSVNAISLWNEATSPSGRTCYMPYTDISNGYYPQEQPQEKTSQRGVFIEPATTVTGSVLVAGPAFSTSSINNAINLAIEEAINATNEWQKRANQIVANLNRHVQEGHSYQATVLWGLTNKPEGSQEYNTVVQWYAHVRNISISAALKEVEDLEKMKIDRTYYATTIKKKMKIDPNIDLGPNPWRIVPKEDFKEFYISKVGNVDSFQADPNRNLYILSHGWSPLWVNTTGSYWAQDMANVILSRDPAAQILLIDWREISHQPLPTGASKWIDAIASPTAEALERWGINKKRTFVMGHSLGSLLSQQLATELGGIKVIGMDPAYWITDYNTDFAGSEFTAFAGNSMCLVADDGVSGSEKLTKTCGENYIIKFNDPHNTFLLREFAKDVVANFVTSEIADIPLKSLNPGAFRTVLKAGNQELIVEVWSEDIKGRELIVGTAKAVITDVATDWACSPALAAPVVGPIAQKGCSALLETSAQAVAAEVRRAFISRHEWVHETFRTIIVHPFVNMTGGRIDSIDHRSEFANDSYKEMNGAIYTERHDPEAIKYLKVLIATLTDKYVLYGNNQANVFECKYVAGDHLGAGGTKRGCIMTGGSSGYVGDKFMLDFDSSSYTIKDFKVGADPDKIEISESNAIITPNGTTFIGSEPVLEIGQLSITGKIKNRVAVTIEGVTREKIGGWVEVAEEDKNLRPSKKRKNPIHIQ